MKYSVSVVFHGVTAALLGMNQVEVALKTEHRLAVKFPFYDVSL